MCYLKQLLEVFYSQIILKYKHFYTINGFQIFLLWYVI